MPCLCPSPYTQCPASVHHPTHNALPLPLTPTIPCLRFRQGFLRFFRWCPCAVCRRQHHLLTSERGAMYSARMSMGSNQGGLLDKNGSLLHTTVESMDDHTVSTYRMVPLRSASTNSARAGGTNNYNHVAHRKL
ncbi:hypothetical protein ElyMa_006927700 [Elysia marginata]|uniref:Phospholipid scramblase n=1 Tax=Elysia marginata TaxID=1093978 RepID=A0AAV4JI54_9GAST|nr:hypothetical protein ElyMa_006927700 [Elysia marginata]